jgi:hypothetical protein
VPSLDDSLDDPHAPSVTMLTTTAEAAIVLSISCLRPLARSRHDVSTRIPCLQATADQARMLAAIQPSLRTTVQGTFDGVTTEASALKMTGAGVAVEPVADMSELASTMIVMSCFGK